LNSAEMQEHQVKGGAVMAHVFYNQQMMPPVWFVQGEPKNFKTKKGELTLTFTGNMDNYYTVLQVSKNPGIIVIWAGFFFLCLGLFLVAFYAPSRHYLIIEADKHLLHIAFVKDNFPFTLKNLFQNMLEQFRKEGP
ncbi:MAG: cytochrome c biogenesis protein ResB, partial [Pseudomonadota bacterium]